MIMEAILFVLDRITWNYSQVQVTILTANKLHTVISYQAFLTERNIWYNLPLC